MMKAKIFDLSQAADIAAALKAGALAVLPTDTVYGLIIAKNAPQAEQKLNAAKNNPPGKPAQVLCTLAQARALAQNTPLFAEYSQKWPGALTLIAPAVGGGAIGLRVPASEFILDIAAQCGPLLASSANMHGAPPCQSAREVLDVFGDIADIIALGGDIKTKPSALIDITGPAPQILR